MLFWMWGPTTFRGNCTTWIVAAISAAGCAYIPESQQAEEPAPSAYADRDLDGADASVDCNEDDAHVFPGAPERCNGIDDDCDRSVDEELLRTYFQDEDHDGYGNPAEAAEACAPSGLLVTDGTDCDDGDPLVHPGVEEVCDLLGVDEDCSGLANDDDPQVQGSTTWFLDEDGDGYGDPTQPVVACYFEPGLSALPTDCNDQDAGVNLGTEEVCDPLDVDEDCDGLADEHDPQGPAGALVWYVDADLDGHGDTSDAGRFHCGDVPADRSLDALDCDDDDPSIHPFAVEVCADGVDNDCDAELDCPPLADLTLDTADLRLEPIRVSELGSVVADLGDLDADGQADFGTAAPNWDYGYGAVLVFEGPATTGSVDPGTLATATVVGSAGSYFGIHMAGGGDIDRDGYDDLLVSQSSPGDVYAFLGPVSGDIAASAADLVWNEAQGGSSTGDALAADFDFDGDGNLDVVIGAPGFNVDGRIDTGAAYVLYGPVSGQSLGSAEATLVGDGSYDFVGDAIAGVPDMDGDGTDELVLGLPWTSTGGVAHLVFGARFADQQTVSTVADRDFVSASSGDFLGWPVGGAKDFNGDGYGDLLLVSTIQDTGATNAGATYVVLGPATTEGAVDDVAHATIYGDTLSEQAGMSLDGHSDMNGDGYSDLLIGAPLHDETYGNDGSVYLVMGPQSGSISVAEARCAMLGTSIWEHAGTSVSFVGDQDGDDVAEVLIGAPYTGFGNAYMVFGDRL